ncbi:hypothetical protein [Pseudoflavitalea rhizosphaerae]|uniref:hypothetical protein n=1 Tax=Pseudoflavitalea rhizosphaerae TaxID=1884793 RepID=UPI000F8CCEE7|nr:hypothetical protein [Pseudoflavitalea rhizosphaerae]
MRNIYCIAAAFICLFSCKKNVESINDKNVNSISGQWASVHMGNPFQVTIAEDKKFSMELPVIVKKESGSKPETLLCRLSGSCIQQDGRNELQADQFSILNEAGSSDLEYSIFQSIANLELVIQRENTAPLGFRITAGRALMNK